MLSVYLGEEVFLKGVARYLKEHAFANAETNDLWKALGHVSGEDITSMMSVWTRNVGYPVITVTEDKDTIHIEQNRYFRSGHPKPDEDQVIWPVMLRLQTGSGMDEKLLLNARSTQIRKPASDFYKFNTGHSGVYRVLYSKNHLHALGEAASQGKLFPADRAGLLYDSISLTQSGHQALISTFKLVRQLSHDSSFFVWQALIAWFSALSSAWMFSSDKKLKAAVSNVQRRLTAPIAHKLGLGPSKTDDVIDALFKPLLFTAAGLAGDTETIRIARDMFQRFVAGDRAAIPSDLRAAVFSIVLHSNGTCKEYDMILEEYTTNAPTVDERSAALSALGFATSPILVARTIALALDAHRIPSTQLNTLLSGLSTHPAGIEALFDTLLHRYDDVTSRFRGGGLGGLARLLPSYCRGLATDEQGNQLEAFFAGKDTKAYARVLAQTVEEIRIRAAWARRDGRELRRWLVLEGCY